MSTGTVRNGLPVAAVVLVLAVGTVIARRRGYAVGGRTPVRCRAGHVFSTIWVPGASLKSIRLGPVRLQFCPVGRHWTSVRPVRPDDLTDAERAEAAQWHDVPLP